MEYETSNNSTNFDTLSELVFKFSGNDMDFDRTSITLKVTNSVVKRSSHNKLTHTLSGVCLTFR